MVWGEGILPIAMFLHHIHLLPQEKVKGAIAGLARERSHPTFASIDPRTEIFFDRRGVTLHHICVDH